MYLYIDVEEHKLGDLGEPTNYKAALLDPESEKWLNAINVEMQSMKYNEVWILVELPPNGQTVGSKWLFKKTTDMDGNVHIYKSRLVAKGYTQTPRIDYKETFSPVADIRAIRILIAIAAYYDYVICQMDVKTTFLNGYLNEEVYMEQPEGFVNPKYPNREAVWVRKIISGLGVVLIIEEPISMYCDNTGAIAIANESRITKAIHSWLSPLYVFVIINTLIITIAATSCFHHHTNHNKVQSQLLDHLPPVTVPPMIVYEDINTLPEVSTMVYEVENLIIDDEPVVVDDKEVQTEFVFPMREKPLAGSRFVVQQKLTAKVNRE
nr:putative retrotransposon Ty1-copia subclass protein [Tanacetum cinerariifolium]